MVQWLGRAFDHFQLKTLVLSSIPNEGFFFLLFFLFFLLFVSFFIIFVILETLQERYSSFALLSFYQKLYFLQLLHIIVYTRAKTHVEDKRGDGNNPRKHYQNSI